MANLYIGQDFEFDIDLRRKDKPLRINDGATVRAGIFNKNGDQQGGWTTYTKNNGEDSDWKLGVLAESIPSSITSTLSAGSAELRINISGQDEDRDGALGNAYDRTWSFSITIK